MFALRVNSGTRLTKKGPQKGDLCIGIWAAIAALFVVTVNRRDRLAGNPSKLTGPSWVEHKDAERGYQTLVPVEKIKGAPKYAHSEAWDWESRERARSLDDYYGVIPT